MQARLKKGEAVAAHLRQVLPVIPMSYQEPIPSGPLPTSAIDSAFAKARETVQRLEAERVEHVGGEWSPAQHTRRAS